MSFFSIFTRTLKISVYYSYKDERLREKLDTHLSSLKQQKGVEIDWYKCQSVAGRNSKQENYRYLNTSHVIVLLVSPDFMDLDDGWEIGRRAMKLYNAEKARVVPVKLRQIDHWEATPFKDLQYLPSNGEPVTNRRVWRNQDEAFLNIAQGIREVVEEEQEQRHRQFNIAEQAAIFAPINSLIYHQFFQRILRFPNISTRSVPIAAGVLAVTALGFYNFSAKNPAESFFNQGEQKSEKSYSQQNQAKNFFNQGKKKSGNGQYLGAVKDYNQAIQIDPNYTDAYIGRGDAHYFLKDYEAAIEDYTQVIRLVPDLADAYMIRAIARCELRDKQGAIKDNWEAAALYAKQGATAKHNKALKRLKCIEAVSHAPSIKLNKQYSSLLN
ncbi:tetratricopeptide repeat protein [Scytonema sp. PRP1]|uniref:tetratricopeptide repeat protein n=1 Tax=Scytonema sp. PRP1 TaxID=3120513 RepID=UPI002FD2FCC1